MPDDTPHAQGLQRAAGRLQRGEGLPHHHSHGRAAQSAHRGHRRQQEDTHSHRGRSHALQRGTGAAHAVGGGAGHPATLTPSQPNQTRHRPRKMGHRVRSIHPPRTMPTEGAQIPHRARSGARGAADTY